MERRKLKGTYKARRRKKFFSVDLFSALFLHCFIFFSQYFAYGDKCCHLPGKLFEMDGK